MRKVHGIGVNDVPWRVYYRDSSGKNVKKIQYQIWGHMLKRCYCPKYQVEFPTYVGCQVDERWHLLSNFWVWYDQNYIEGYQLDKDFLGNGKLYSPETCCFIPCWLNTIFNDSGRSRGEWPIGVDYRKKSGRFRSQVSINGKLTHLGYFDTPEEAHQTYLEAKKEYVLEKLENYPDQRIKEAVYLKLFGV